MNRPVLLALQSTTEGIEDRTLDTVTLVLLVGFVVSLVVLSFLLARQEGETVDGEETARTDRTQPAETTPPPPRPRSMSPTPPVANKDSVPVWLSGVRLPHSDHGLSEASSIIERLLEARRRQDLSAGIALYTPAFRAKQATQLGVQAEELARALEQATFDGVAPALRSVELLSGTGDSLRVRATYSDRSAEVYQLQRIDGCWAIDSIERG